MALGGSQVVPTKILDFLKRLKRESPEQVVHFSHKKKLHFFRLIFGSEKKLKFILCLEICNICAGINACSMLNQTGRLASGYKEKDFDPDQKNYSDP